jgi:PAS domain S-box-containing protein
MTSIKPDLLERLQEIASQSGLSVDDLLENWIDNYETSPALPAKALELAIDAVISVNEQQEIIFFNQGAETIFGYAAEELLGKPLDILIPDDIVPIHREHVVDFVSSEASSRLMANRRANVLGLRKDGTVFPLEASISKVRWNDRVIFTAIIRDVSQRRSLEQELRQERDLIGKIMDTSPAAITVVDTAGQIIFANRRAEEIHGVSKDEIASRTYDDAQWHHTDLVGNPWPNEKQPFVRVMKTKKPVYNIRHAIEWSNGKKVYLNINGAPMFDENGNISKVVFTVEDISFQKQIEDELKAALDNERHLNEIKSIFLSVVSHEFRTPLTLILTNTGYLRLKLDELERDEILGRLANIDRQVNRLRAMVDEVSFISRSHIGQIQLKPKRIRPLEYLEKSAEEIKSVYPDKEVEIILEPKGAVATAITVDDYLLDRIVTNVLGNAVKYSDDKSTVFLRYKCTLDAFELEIQDFGRGIPAEDHVHLFELFYRGTNVEGIAGTGLGLVVASKAVESHNGTLWFDSIIGQGTTFRITLPYLD